MDESASADRGTMSIRGRLLHLWARQNPSVTVGTGNVQNRLDWVSRQLAGLPAGTTLLDVGAGERQYEHLCGHLHYTSQDFAQYDGHGNNAGLQMGTWDNSGIDIVSDAASIPTADQSFEAILCTEVLEHVPHPREVLREFARILQPGGRLILTAPFCSHTHFAPFYYYNGFSSYFFDLVLDECGFDVGEIEFNGSYFDYLAQELRRVERVAERYSDAPRMRFVDALAYQRVLSRLELCSRLDRGSAELLAYGLHVRAVRRGTEPAS